MNTDINNVKTYIYRFFNFSEAGFEEFKPQLKLSRGSTMVGST